MIALCNKIGLFLSELSIGLKIDTSMFDADTEPIFFPEKFD